MDRLDDLHRATLVDQAWRPRSVVIAERRMVAATVVDSVPVVSYAGPRTPPAPPPKPQTPRSEPETAPEPTSDPLQELARGGK